MLSYHVLVPVQSPHVGHLLHQTITPLGTVRRSQVGCHLFLEVLHLFVTPPDHGRLRNDLDSKPRAVLVDGLLDLDKFELLSAPTLSGAVSAARTLPNIPSPIFGPSSYLSFTLYPCAMLTILSSFGNVLVDFRGDAGSWLKMESNSSQPQITANSHHKPQTQLLELKTQLLKMRLPNYWDWEKTK